MIKVSVLIPVYNEEKYIEDSIKSVLNQNFKNFEIIVINGFFYINFPSTRNK